ncbi:MAG: hypothetical protein FWD21_02355 [Peptococcaceae bacterium]|nr:hypothetical protein [Peptococcaceae bacterium]
MHILRYDGGGARGQFFRPTKGQGRKNRPHVLPTGWLGARFNIGCGE